ncbi:MAG TPA: hypothetical protein VGV38_18055, partial [Pyrinomonadaceae bacterium]|nr:hypothetical protein [Pyrinomonadaceae bacterium]
MYSIASGNTHGLTDTEAFVKLLGRLPGRFGDTPGEFFESERELFVARAPGRLDLMGGIADY